MAGKIKRMIERILAERSKGDELLARVITTKLILKGIDPKKFSDKSDDDPQIIEKLGKMMRNLLH